jgi:hypothetical protein
MNEKPFNPDDEDNDVLFTCELCGKQFEPTPDAMVEWEWGPELLTPEQSQSLAHLTVEDLEEMEHLDYQAVGLTKNEVQKLLNGDRVKKGGCVCLQCQDEFIEENPESK